MEKVSRLLELKVKVKSRSRVRLFATQWTVAYQALPSMGFSRQEYWSELPFPSPGDLPTQELNPGFPHCRQMSEPPGKSKGTVLGWVLFIFSKVEK